MLELTSTGHDRSAARPGQEPDGATNQGLRLRPPKVEQVLPVQHRDRPQSRETQKRNQNYILNFH